MEEDHTVHRPLAQALIDAVRAQDFAGTADGLLGGRPVEAFPSIDLALVVFGRSPATRPRWANVLFSREHPQGLIGQTGPGAKSLRHLRIDRDQRDAKGDSNAWLPGSDWSRLTWQPLQGDGAVRVVAPYPASLIKLMVAVGVAMAVEAGRVGWTEALADLHPMITVSDNDATDRCVALLHRTGQVNALNARLQQWGLATLQLNGTTPAGGWRNGDGSGVGQLHMTAWDTARLLWLLDEQAPAAPWLAPAAPRLSATSCARLRELLQRQQLDEILSSGALRGVPGWVPGLPDAPAFAHKTGTTQNYASDAGIVRTERAHYIVALLTNLGTRYAPHEKCATTWRIPALGAQLHRIVEQLA
jgi:hypothetical protein